MQNNPVLIVVAIFCFCLVGIMSRADLAESQSVQVERDSLPETIWLRDYLKSKFVIMGEERLYTSRHPVELNKEQVGKLQSLLEKILAQKGELSEDDILAGRAAVWLLLAAKVDGFAATVIPLLKCDQVEIRISVAEALSSVGNDGIVVPIEQAFVQRVGAFAAGNSKEMLECYWHLYSLAMIGTSKAREAFEQCREKAISAAGDRGAEIRKTIDKILIEVAEKKKKAADENVPELYSPKEKGPGGIPKK